MSTTLLPCETRPADYWFPENVRSREAKIARQLCAGCPDRQPCLERALNQADDWGIRGGLDADERKKILRAQGRPATPQEKRLADRRELTLRLSNLGWSNERIGDHLGAPRSQVQADLLIARKAATLAAYPTPEQRIDAACRGERVWLSPAEKTAAIDRLDDGRPATAVALMLDIGTSSVWNRRHARDAA